MARRRGKGQTRGKKQGPTAAKMVSTEGVRCEVSALALREEKLEEQDGGVSIEEGGFEGFESPLFAGSVCMRGPRST